MDRMDRDDLSNSTDVSPLTSGRSLGEGLECYDLTLECASAKLPPDVLALRRRRPLEPASYIRDIEPFSEDDPLTAMWREHMRVFEYIEREAWHFEAVLKNFFYFHEKVVAADPDDDEEKVLGYCDKYGLHLAFLRGVDRKFNSHLDIALRIETRDMVADAAPKPMGERCVLREFEEVCDKEVLDVHEDTKKMLEMGEPPFILADVGYSITRKLVAEIGLNYSEENDYYDCREEWEDLCDEWSARMCAFLRMSTRLFTHALPHLDGFLPSVLIMASEILKEAQAYERNRVRDRSPRGQILADMEDSVFGLAFDAVIAAAKIIVKTDNQLFKEGGELGEEGVKNRVRAKMIWSFFLTPLRREWERRQSEVEGFENIIDSKFDTKEELYMSEFVLRRVAELIAIFAEAKDTDTFLLDMCKPDDDGGLLFCILQMMVRPKKLFLSETIAKVARAAGLMCDHNCVYECPEYLMQMMLTLRGLYMMASMTDISAVNRSQAKSSVMWALSKFWDIVGETHTGEVVGSVQSSHEIITCYDNMFIDDQSYVNYSFCRSLGGFYKWLPAVILENQEVADLVQATLSKLCAQLCNSTDFKLRWNVAYAVGCCFGNENIFRVMESVIMDTALVPMCNTIRRSQNFKERIQALIALGKLLRGSALKSSLGFVLESICNSVHTLPHDTPAQHCHANKFKVEAASSFCHIVSILEPVDLRMLEEVLSTNIEHVRGLLLDVEAEMPESKSEIVMRAYDRLGAIVARRKEGGPASLEQVETLMTEILGRAVVDRDVSAGAADGGSATGGGLHGDPPPDDEFEYQHSPPPT